MNIAICGEEGDVLSWNGLNNRGWYPGSDGVVGWHAEPNEYPGVLRGQVPFGSIEDQPHQAKQPHSDAQRHAKDRDKSW